MLSVIYVLFINEGKSKKAPDPYAPANKFVKCAKADLAALKGAMESLAKVPDTESLQKALAKLEPSFEEDVNFLEDCYIEPR